MSRPISSTIDIGEPVVTRAYVVHPITGDPVFKSDVSSITVVAWHRKRKVPIWSYPAFDPNDADDPIATMYDTPQTSSTWSANSAGYTLLSIIPYGGETQFRPPSGQVLRIELVFTLNNGYTFTVKRDVTFEGVRAISSGMVST